MIGARRPFIEKNFYGSARQVRQMINTNDEKIVPAHQTRKSAMSGFSLIELFAVLAVILIVTAISVPYMYNYTKLYKSEDQAIKVMDLMREAGQLALTRRKTMRLEIDLTDNMLLIIDENGAGAADDREIKAIPLYPAGDIRVDQIPSGITKPNPPNYNDAVFAADTIGHLRGTTRITGNNVWTARFRRDGTVVNAAGIPISANLYVWAPVSNGSPNPRNNREVRAITIFGGTGAIRYWKHNGAAFVASQ